MRLSEFQYDLPRELIAQQPAESRENSRLMVIRRDTQTIEHSHFHQLPQILDPGDLLVLNDTRVFPARLLGQKTPGGARIEVLLLEQTDDQCWKVLAQRARRLREGSIIKFGRDFFSTVVEVHREGVFVMKFSFPGPWQKVLEQYGQVPLPPYISRPADIESPTDDRQRYQTVYARHNGSAAAPTAGLHFTEAILNELHKAGIANTFLTLHVGLDTFQPVKTANIEEHKIHSEHLLISPGAAETINTARNEDRRVIAVGTTCVRALETATDAGGPTRPFNGKTDLFIYPGYKFSAVDVLLTNFHLPCSSLLMLVSAFMGSQLRKKSYQEAIAQRYRFYSYGDAMLIF